MSRPKFKNESKRLEIVEGLEALDIRIPAYIDHDTGKVVTVPIKRDIMVMVADFVLEREDTIELQATGRHGLGRKITAAIILGFLIALVGLV